MNKTEKSKITFFKADISTHEDNRRRIFGIVLPAEINFAARGVKTINFSRSGVVVGNHYHTIESGRIEGYIGIGAPGVELFNFAYRDGGGIKKKDIFKWARLFYPARSHTSL